MLYKNRNDIINGRVISILLCELPEVIEMTRNFFLECGHVIATLQYHPNGLFLESVHAFNLLLVTITTIGGTSKLA